MNDRVTFLKRTLLKRLDDQQLVKIAQAARLRQFAHGTPVYLPAEDASEFMLLVSGRIKICSITHEGKQGILSLVEAGQLFGEASLLDRARWEDYAEAMNDSLVLSIPRHEFLSLMVGHASISLAVTELLAVRRRRSERRLKYLLFRSNRHRLIHLLFDLVEDYGIRCDDTIELDLKLSHQDLAGMIGSTRETVTVTLGELQREGSLLIRRRKLVITDPRQLAETIEAPLPFEPRQQLVANCSAAS